MKLFSKKPLVLATAAVLGFGMAGAVHAAATAVANLNILNLKVFDFSNPGSPVQITIANVGGYLANLSASNSATNTAILTGVGADVQPAGPSPGAIDAAQACVGSCGGIAENTFTQTPGFPPGTQGNFERADSQLTGSILGANGANAQEVAEGQLPNPGSGQSNSTVGTSTGFTFRAVAAVPFQFTFDATGDLVTRLTATSSAGSSASASLSYSINLTDMTANTTLLAFSPDALNTNRSVTNPPGPGSSTYPNTLCGSPPCNLGSFAPTSGNLTIGHNYQLTINQTANQSETQVGQSGPPVGVPEPATLALLGSGLLGFGGMRRFRKA